MVLGTKIIKFDKEISLEESHYMEKILQKYIYFDYKPAYTLYDPNVKLFKNIVDNVRQTGYESIFGSHGYAIDCI